MKKTIIAISVLSLLIGAISCSEEKGQAILTIANIDESSSPFGDTLDNKGTVPTDTINIELHNDLKSPDGLEYSSYADIMIDSITVTYSRTDGGSDTPNGFKHNLALKVPANGAATLSNFRVLTGTQKFQFPVSDLIHFGYERSTDFLSIKMNILLEVTGKTLEGDPVFARGSISIEVTDWAD